LKLQFNKGVEYPVAEIKEELETSILCQFYPTHSSFIQETIMSKRLFRNRYDKKIAGVSSGLAEYFDVDSSLVRIAFILLTFLNGVGILAYIVFWIALPEHSFAVANQTIPQDEMNSFVTPESTNRSKRNGTFILGLTLIALGCLFLLDRVFPQISGEDYLAISMIVCGSIVLYSGYSSNREVVEANNSSQNSSFQNVAYSTAPERNTTLESVQDSTPDSQSQISTSGDDEEITSK
jgi:phage shock protein C